MVQKSKQTLAIWHELVDAQDASRLPDIFSDGAVFRSPFAFTPYQGRDACVLILSNVMDVFENFTYHRELIDYETGDAFLEFTANVGDKKIKGMDLIQFGQDGLITDFEVLIRPMSALIALAEQMSPRIAALGKTTQPS